MQFNLQNFRYKNTLLFSGLILALLGVYFNAFFNGFIFDDETLILNNRYLQHWGDWWLFFVSSHSAGGGIASPFYRPFQLLVYLVLYQINGPSPVLYHAFNVFLHAFNACLVYVLGKRLGFNPVSMFFAALLWAVHPVHSEAVAYASGTADVLYVFFALLGFIILLPDFTKQKILFSLPLFIFALLSKETAVVFPLLATILQSLVMRKYFSLKAASRLWPLWCVAILYAVAHMLVPTFSGFALYNQHNACTDSLACRIFTYLATLPAYGSLLIWPFHLHPERSFHSFTQPWHLQVIAGMAIVALTLWLAVARRTIDQKRILTTGILWFLAAGFLSGGILLPVNGVFMEHWLYLPTIGLFICLGESVSNIVPRKMGGLALIAVTALTMFWGARTIEQNATWQNAQVFYANIFAIPRFRDYPKKAFDRRFLADS